MSGGGGSSSTTTSSINAAGAKFRKWAGKPQTAAAQQLATYRGNGEAEATADLGVLGNLGRLFSYSGAKRNNTNIRNVGGAQGRATGNTQRALKSLTGQ